MPAIGYHCQAKAPISRSAGRSAVAAAAYRTRSRMEDERYGKTHDYSKRPGLEFVYHAAPKDAPAWAHDVGQAWNAVEARENRKNSTLAFDYDMAFPYQISGEQREWMLKDWVREELTRKGLIATAVIHAPDKDGDQRNYHGHLMFSDRPIDESGFASHKDRRVQETEFMLHLKERWAELGARQLERAGYPVEAERWRHGHQKIETQCALAMERGDTAYAQELRFREATKHLGHVASGMEREGQKSDRGNENREIEAGNAARQELGKELAAVTREIAALERVPEAVTVAAPEPVKVDRWQEEREQAAAAIREAWKTAERDPVSFAIGLGEQGLTLAENDKGRFVAVDERGAAHYLTAAALGEKPINVQQELETAFKSDGSVSLPSVGEVRAELKEQREAERAESALGWAATRRAEARERAAQWEANREIWQEQRQLDRQIEWVERAQERPQNEVMQEIGKAYADSNNGAEFVHELEQRGLMVCRVNAEEAERSKNQREWLKTASYQEGEYLAVTEWGAAYRLNAETIALTATNYYDHQKNVTERLATIEPQSVVTFHEAQEIITEQQEERGGVVEPSPLEAVSTGLEAVADAAEQAADTAGHVAAKGVEVIGRMGAVIANGLEALFFGGASRQAPGGAESTQEAPPKQTREQKQETQKSMKEPPAWWKAKQQLNREPELFKEANTEAARLNNPGQVSPEMEAAVRRHREEQERKRERERER